MARWDGCRPPFVAECPGYILSPGRWENVYFRAGGVVSELNLNGSDTGGQSAGWAWLAKHGNHLSCNVCRPYVEDINGFSRRDTQRYAELVSMGSRSCAFKTKTACHIVSARVRTVAAALTAVPGDKQCALSEYSVTTTAIDSSDGLFESEAVRGISRARDRSLADANGSALAVLASSLIHHQGAVRPSGGMGGLVAALERCRGPRRQVRLGSEVARIWRAASVLRGRTDRCTVLHASQAVIAACPVEAAGPGRRGHADRIAERLRHAPANATDSGRSPTLPIRAP